MFLTITLKILKIPAYSCLFLLLHLLLTPQITPQLNLISIFSYILAAPPPPKLACVHYSVKSHEHVPPLILVVILAHMKLFLT